MNARFKEALRRILPRSVVHRRILGGPLRGEALVTSWYDYPAAILGRTERPLLDWFRRNVGTAETWLDIGAHYGYTAIALSRLVGSEGRVYAFEPLVSTAGCVSRTRTLNGLRQLTVVPVALGDCDGVSAGHLPSVRGMLDSTLVGGFPDEAFLVAGLDWLWPRICNGKDRIDGMKIDVQGMEVEVLRGMLGCLRTYRPKLVIEMHCGVSRREILDLLAGLGYLASADPIERMPGETQPQFADDRSYVFLPEHGIFQPL